MIQIAVRTFERALSTVGKQQLRQCSSVYKTEFLVNQFCRLNVNCPYSLTVQPLDEHLYPDSNKVFINVTANSSESPVNVNCVQTNDTVDVSCEPCDLKGIKCFIKTPIKSDLNLKTKQGLLNVEKFNGGKMILKSESGDIVIQNCQNSEVCAQNNSGNIYSKGLLYAAVINFETKQQGVAGIKLILQFIETDHIQALTTNFLTETGNINVKSMYCEDSHFVSISGTLSLKNIHKRCFINISDNGFLTMTGFDGTLVAHLNNGKADIQISQLHGVSSIKSEQKTSIFLKLAESIQETCKIKIDSESLMVSDTFNFRVKSVNNWTILNPPTSNPISELIIKSKQSEVVIDKASWSDIFKRN